MQHLNSLIEARYVDGKIVVHSQDDTNALKQRGYGEQRKKKSGTILSFCEALYLIEQKRIHVINPKNKQDLTFLDILGEFRLTDNYAWMRYLIYKDLRDRGYTVKEKFDFEVDFEVYERGKSEMDEPKYIVVGVSEGAPVKVDQIVGMMRKTRDLERELVLAVVDRRSEVIYYSVSEQSL
ncbi:MAG TPA: tRNA-intron lyase [archaeon]|nr:tRNA-intron lyase [archaeon]